MFFVNTGGKRGISHVALYIGGGRMVHAMTPRYGVQISGIWDSYWTPTIETRLIPPCRLSAWHSARQDIAVHP